MRMARTQDERAEAARLGGHALVARYGAAYMRQIGRRGSAGTGRRPYPTAADRAEALRLVEEAAHRRT